jgi:membrane-bound lytic murein transglycosylase A
MKHARLGLACLLIGGSVVSAGAASLSAQADLQRLTFAELRGWEVDDHGEAFAAFRRSCRFMKSQEKPVRTGKPTGAKLARVCAEALSLGNLDNQAARSFFESRFTPFAVVPKQGDGFLTAYYEPEFKGSRRRTATYQVPLLAKPDDLVTIPQGRKPRGLPPGLQAARRKPGGKILEPYPDRAAIETGALGDLAKPVVYLKEPGEAFIIHVQGSARIKLSDGTSMRVAYAGRNGRPYTSIGKLLVQRGELDLESMTLAKLMGWLKDHPDDARDLMRQNQSYIFFREATELAHADGPVGGAGHPLVPGRSLAVDRSLWSYGVPFWLDGTLPRSLTQAEPLQRLMIAQDTGSAIVGPARGDFFFGSGEEAGRLAGLMRHKTRFFVLQPKG